MRSTIRFFLLACLFLSIKSAHTQSHRSVHEAQKMHFDSLGISTEAEWDSLHGIEEMPGQGRANCDLEKVVYGWHPYWMGTAYSNYQWDLLSHFSYFSYEVDPNTGYPGTTHGWLSSNAVTEAQNNGVKADLCVTLFNDHDDFFNSSTAQQNLIDTLISLVQARNANGVNIDFENIADSLGTDYNDFLVDLSTQMHNQIPGSEVSVALFSVDWGNIFDIGLLDQHLDYFVIMGYGYHYSGSAVAGPTDPLYDFGSGTRNLSRTVNSYLNKGANRSKLVLGLPYYGYEWETASEQIPENTTNSGVSRTYTTVRDNASGNYSAADQGWDHSSQSPYFVFQENGTWNQCFADLAPSLDRRYDMVHRRGLAGMGIWALGYDDGYSELWDLIETNFSDCRSVPCSDTLYDMGGPSGDYYNDELYAFTIDPDAAGKVELSFQDFDIESGYDSLWLYDGADTTAPLIGGYSGVSGPGTIISSGEAITLEFESDGATTAPGWKAVWNCLPDTIPPGSEIGALPEWVTEDFTLSFSDTDNTGGSGVEEAFYQVLEKDSNEWRGNVQKGFFRDAFLQQTLHSDWNAEEGNWSLDADTLLQSDESHSNTNIHASLEQDLSDRYIYRWKAKMGGSGNNRRSGFHYFCDSAELSNRGNSYFVWSRLDDDKIQLYKVVNDSWGSGPVKETPYPFQEDRWYSFTLAFDRISGETWVYVDGELEMLWQDPSPHSSGNALSFRSGNAELRIGELGVHRSRGSTVNIPVGPDTSDMMRFQSDGPGNYAGKIGSLLQDSAGTLSPIVQDSVKVDTSAPLTSSVRDGPPPGEKDTVLDPGGTLQADWDSATDPHSGIEEHAYAIGSSPGDSDIVGWSGNINDTSVTVPGLSLEADSLYYFSVRTFNAAGLRTTDSSDGVRVLYSSALKDPERFEGRIVPNPFRERIELRWEGELRVERIRLFDASGREVPIETTHREKGRLLLQVKGDGTKGIHFLWVERKRGKPVSYELLRK